MNQTNPLAETDRLMSVFMPEPSDRNRQTQMGVHFEEVGEMLDTLAATDEESGVLLQRARESIHALANHMKTATPGAVFLPMGNAVDFLDSVADQLVTVTGVAYGHNMDPVGALAEVNRSNASKLDDEGKPILDPVSNKWVKGPNYRPPDLSPFLVR